MLLIISIIHIVVCLFLILVVLLQQGKGADLSVFGGGGTQAAFGARGATTFLHKLTVFAFVGFIVTTMAIGLLKTSQRSSSVITDAPAAAPLVTEEAAEAAADAVDETTTTIDEAIAGAAEAIEEAVDGGDEPADEGGDNDR